MWLSDCTHHTSFSYIRWGLVQNYDTFLFELLILNSKNFLENLWKINGQNYPKNPLQNSRKSPNLTNNYQLWERVKIAICLQDYSFLSKSSLELSLVSRIFLGVSFLVFFRFFEFREDKRSAGFWLIDWLNFYLTIQKSFWFQSNRRGFSRISLNVFSN